MSERSTPNVLTGTRIRERRLSLSRRQSDIARAVGISPAYLNLIEHNRRPVSTDLVTRLAAELEVPADELAEGREEIRIAALREAAAHPVAAGLSPELDQVAEFLARFPGWAQLLIAQTRRAGGLERQLVYLSDRMTQ
ncbi:MAG: helix-turn-helix transcriptional regulator, partial [Paracoccus sp. (in: a-proteobacteria)]|nr:helix-turn-helix transcriptional regulator [Paracoccus sp. (in: a-proteobacteria)]